MAVIFHSLKEPGINVTHGPLSLSLSLSQAARPEVGSSRLSSAGTVAIKDDDTHINTRAHTHTLHTSCGREWAHRHQLERAMVSGKRCEQEKWCVWVSVNM